ncbi:MAG: hypothetical protein U9Q38_06405, partial [Thermodesulfobacteriota bacterium]|nr:hypothetical protein [Thermodesulfobacteriota bacterium]
KAALEAAEAEQAEAVESGENTISGTFTIETRDAVNLESKAKSGSSSTIDALKAALEAAEAEQAEAVESGENTISGTFTIETRDAVNLESKAKSGAAA